MRMSRMTPILTVFLVGVFATTALVRAQSGDAAAVMLEVAIQTELVDGDLDKAIGLYAEIVDRFSNERLVAAQALLHIGQSYDKLGEPKAREAYERLLTDYADQSRVAAEARVGLAALVEVRPAAEAPVAGAREAWTRPAPAVPAFAPGLGRFLIFNDLSVHNRNTGETRRLSSDTRSAAYPMLSPDGARVAYLSWSAGSETGADELSRQRPQGSVAARVNPRLSAELRVVGLDGSGERVLVSAEGVPWLRPFAWSADGT